MSQKTIKDQSPSPPPLNIMKMIDGNSLHFLSFLNAIGTDHVLNTLVNKHFDTWGLFYTIIFEHGFWQCAFWQLDLIYKLNIQVFWKFIDLSNMQS